MTLIALDRKLLNRKEGGLRLNVFTQFLKFFGLDSRPLCDIHTNYYSTDKHDHPISEMLVNSSVRDSNY